MLYKFHYDGTGCPDLSDKREDYLDLGNEIRMRVMRERLLEALQTHWAPSYFNSDRRRVSFGNKIFATMNEQQQRSFLRRIVALPVHKREVGDVWTNNGVEKPEITIHMSA
jgi:hypothetical protein